MAETGSIIVEIPLERIIISGNNPRQSFDEESLQRLGESIKAHGQVQNVLVRPSGNDYELVVGERRLRACALIGLPTIRAEVRDLDDAAAHELRLIENVHREDLSYAEKGDAVLQLWACDKYETLKEVCESIQVEYNTVKVHWLPKARKLSSKVKTLITQGNAGVTSFSDRHAYCLLKYSHAVQNRLADVSVESNLTSRQLKALTKLYDENPKADLNQLADEVLGIKKVEILESDLTYKQKKKIEKSKEKTLPPDELRCIAITGSGTRCKNKHLPDKDYCGTHDPEKEKKPKVEKKPFKYKKVKIKSTETRKPLAINSLNELTSKEWLQFTKSWYEHNAVRSDLDELMSIDDDIAQHPATFSQTMITWYVRFFTKKGELVLDPFVGIGSTLVACSRTGRKGIGIDISPEYCRIAKKWIKDDPNQKVILGDSWKLEELDLPNNISYTITSPPYYKMLEKQDHDAQLRIDKGLATEYDTEMKFPKIVEEYIDWLVELFSKIAQKTTDRGHCTIILQNYRDKSNMIPLAYLFTVKMIEKADWTFKGTRIWCQSQKTLQPYGYPYDFVLNVHHHHCLIFKKKES